MNVLLANTKNAQSINKTTGWFCNRTAPLALLALILLPAGVQAAEVHVTGAKTDHVINPGFATASTGDRGSFAEGNAYEFLAGVGVSAFASSNGIPGTATQVGALGKASLSDSFRVTLGQVTDVGSATSFLLTVPIVADGTASLSWTPLPLKPEVTTFGGASYSYSWSVGNVSGSGEYALSKTPTRPQTIRDTKTGGTNAVFMVKLGQVVSLRLSAKADVLVTTFSNLSASGAADFGHTLRWGGVSDIVGFDSAGNQVVLPTDFSLSLISDQTGFNYMKAASPNPYTSTTPVPEPTSWAMMLAGFTLIGALTRKRT